MILVLGLFPVQIFPFVGNAGTHRLGKTALKSFFAHRVELESHFWFLINSSHNQAETKI